MWSQLWRAGLPCTYQTDMTIEHIIPQARPRQTKTLTTVVPTIRVRNHWTGCCRLAHWHITPWTKRANESLKDATSCPQGWPTTIERLSDTVSHIMKRNTHDYCKVDDYAEAGNSSYHEERNCTCILKDTNRPKALGIVIRGRGWDANLLKSTYLAQGATAGQPKSSP